jgi:hypothetical protein
MKSQSHATAVRANEFRDSGHFCATAGRQRSVIAKKIALNDWEYRAVLEMISLSRRTRICGENCREFLHRVFTVVGFLWLVDSSERNTKAGAADVDRKMLREYCS